MDKNPDPKLVPLRSVDETRRRLTKAGLAAPAVLGALASRPVLGQGIHNCTPSGHISGFASPPPGGGVYCASLGQPPSYFASGGPSTWPSAFYTVQGQTMVPRLFKESPAGVDRFFVDAYEVTYSTGNKPPRAAMVWDVLVGDAVTDKGESENNASLIVKNGYFDTTAFTLGKEAIAACMNALLNPTMFPISALGVVDMFNNVITGGLDPVADGLTWNAAEVIEYFESLHP